MRNESDVKKEVKKVLSELGVFWFMPVQTGYGVKGVPDFVCCVCGKFLGIETKFGGNDLSTWQKIQRDRIFEARGLFLVIDEDSIEDWKNYIKAIIELEDGRSRN
jgi:hypothetical protein